MNRNLKARVGVVLLSQKGSQFHKRKARQPQAVFATLHLRIKPQVRRQFAQSSSGTNMELRDLQERKKLGRTGSSLERKTGRQMIICATNLLQDFQELVNNILKAYHSILKPQGMDRSGTSSLGYRCLACIQKCGIGASSWTLKVVPLILTEYVLTSDVYETHRQLTHLWGDICAKHMFFAHGYVFGPLSISNEFIEHLFRSMYY